MNGNLYAIAAYTVGLGLFWAYAAAVWLSGRSLDHRAGVVQDEARPGNDRNRGTKP